MTQDVPPPSLARLAGLAFGTSKSMQRVHVVWMTNFQSLGKAALGIVAVIIAAYLAVIVISNLLPTYAGGVSSISENVSTAEWGDPTADSLGPVFAMVISLGGMFALVGLALAAFHLKKSG
jgi:hypothetical protein